jgi:hypothetical protein
METQGALPSGGWPWDEFFASSILADIYETQPAASMDLNDSDRAVADGTEANNAGGEISAASNGSCHPTSSFFSFNHGPPEHYDLFATNDGNPFNKAHPDNTGPFASDAPHDTLPMNLCGTNVE